MNYVSPSKGPMSFEKVFEDILEFAGSNPDDRYVLIIGTDSQNKEDETCYVTAIIVHREGKGGRFFYVREKETRAFSLKQRIFYETAKSLNVASLLATKLAETGHEFNIEIHLDVGTNGATKELIKEVVGMVSGSGFNARIKPDSYGASSVADRYTK